MARGGDPTSGNAKDDITFETIEGVIIWTGHSGAPVAAIVWAEDSASLVYVPRSVLPAPPTWRPVVGDVVQTRVIESRIRRDAYSLRLLVPAALADTARTLERALTQLTW
ncbi:MAG: hypothetical protein AAFX45_02305 [Pseudomonadota bacterium]